MSNQIYLAIYDLSMGTAHHLSTMFLGPDNVIPIIPHTAIIAYNYEYFFSSGGVQKVNSSSFRNMQHMHPIEQKLIGNTNKSQSEFENWLFFGNDTPNKFHGSQYDLFNHNCNTFSDYCLKVGLGFNNGVPKWILEVPQKVMSSPLGSMLAQSMQGVQPFADGNVAPTTHKAVPQSTRNEVQTKSNLINSELEKNPWMNNASITTPLLDIHGNVLLSQDSTSINMCIQKLINATCQNQNNQEQKEALQVVEKSITVAETSTSLTSDVVHKALGPFLLNEANYSEQEGESSSSSTALYALMVVRLLLLRNKPSPLNLKEFIVQISKMLQSLKKESTRSMAWCTLSNTFCNSHHWKELVPFFDELVDTALAEITSTDNLSLKQSSSTFLYNLIHSTSFDEMSLLSDWIVNIVCSIGQNLELEQDEVTQERRIVILGKILKNSLQAKTLVKDIGLGNLFSNGDDLVIEKNKRLAREISSIVEQSEQSGKK